MGEGQLATAFVFMVLGLSIFFIPWRHGFHFWMTIRDVGIVVGINLGVIIIITVICLIYTGSSDPNYMVLLFVGIGCQIAGFTVCGILIQHDRLSHLSHVLVGIWLLNAIQCLLPELTLKHWFLSFFTGLITMWIGFAISYLIRKPHTLTEHISLGNVTDDRDSTQPSE